MEIRRLLLDQKSELEEKEKRISKVVRREFLPQYEKFLQTRRIKVAVGIRRSGKSFSTYLLLKNRNFAYANFDEEVLLKLSHQELMNSFFETYGKAEIFFLDEVQNLRNWELFLNKLHRSGYNVFVTGSNATLLSSELADRLTGRHVNMEIYPFSFREFLSALNFEGKAETTKEIGLIKNAILEYLEKSGFPEVVVENEAPKSYLRELLNDIVEKDIEKRYKIRRRTTLKEIVYFLISNMGNYTTYNSLKNFFNLGSEHTAKDYLSYLENAYLFVFLNKFSFSSKDTIKSPKKIYCIDSAFSFLGLRASENLGRLMENLVAIELLRRKSYWFNDWEIFYWKDYQQNEVDFVVKEGLEVKQLIQVTYASSKDEIEKREIKGLLKASDLLKCRDLLIITWDYEDELKEENRAIKCIPLWKWLIKL